MAAWPALFPPPTITASVSAQRRASHPGRGIVDAGAFELLKSAERQAAILDAGGDQHGTGAKLFAVVERLLSPASKMRRRRAEKTVRTWSLISRTSLISRSMAARGASRARRSEVHEFRCVL
jgi:hypothetical protein